MPNPLLAAKNSQKPNIQYQDVPSTPTLTQEVIQEEPQVECVALAREVPKATMEKVAQSVVSIDGELLEAGDMKGAKTSKLSPVAEQLVNKGLSVDQLLAFYDEYRRQGVIEKDTRTAEVVARIIIPETCDPPRCYMDSEFMRNLGGGRRAKRLCSHAWASRFVNLTLNIVLDASEWSRDELLKSTVNNGWEAYYKDGYLDAKRLREKMKVEHLNKTYWLCIFAVDEHRAICGDCWTCKDKHDWQADPTLHMKANPCLSCGRPKFNPCPCGSVKYVLGDPWFELDQFPAVVAQMEALVVSLDPHMTSIKRVWVVAEIGEAMQFTIVFFRLALGLAPEVMEELLQGNDLMDTVENCQSTSDDDKQRIMKVIRAMDGGVSSYDQFINCMLEIHFGRCTRLSQLTGDGLRTMESLHQLEMNYSWHEQMQSTDEIVGDAHQFDRLINLRSINVSFGGCTELVSIEAFCKCLRRLRALQELDLDFNGCHGLESVGELGHALSSLNELVSVSLNFSSCDSLVSADELGSGLENLSQLKSLKIDFESCEKLVYIIGLGHALERLDRLLELNLNFSRCSSLVLVDELGSGFEGLQKLNNLDLNFYNCTKVVSVKKLGSGLASLHSLQKMNLNFWNCENLVSIDELGAGLRKIGTLSAISFNLGFTAVDQTCVTGLANDLSDFSALESLELNLSNCLVANIDGVSRSLAKLINLTSLVLYLDSLDHLHSISDLGNTLSTLQRLTSVSVSFLGCTELGDCDLESFAHCAAITEMTINFSACGMSSIVLPDWTGCPALSVLKISCMHCESLNKIVTSSEGLIRRGRGLSVLDLNFFACSNLVSIEELGAGLAKMTTLTSLTLNFSHCFDLRSIDAIGECLTSLGNLTTLNLEFAGCANIPHIDAVGKGVLCLEALISVKADFSGAWHPMKINSIDYLVNSLACLRTLKSIELKFGLCERLALGNLAEGVEGFEAFMHPTSFMHADFCAQFQADAKFYLDLRDCKMVHERLQKEFTRADDFVRALQGNEAATEKPKEEYQAPSKCNIS